MGLSESVAVDEVADRFVIKSRQDRGGWSFNVCHSAW